MVTKIRKTIIVATKTTATVMAATQPLTWLSRYIKGDRKY